MQTILCRPGELWLKSEKVRARWEQVLVRNIKTALKTKKIKFKILRQRGRIFIEVPQKQTKKALLALQKTFGIVSISPVERTTLANLKKAVLAKAKRVLKKRDSFAVRVHRVGRHKFTSKELEKKFGAAIVKQSGNKVNLSKPDKTIFVEVREKDVYVFSEKFPTAGGIPLGVEGKVICLFSGSQADLVTAWLMMKRGCRTILFTKTKAKKAFEILRAWDPNLKIVESKKAGQAQLKELAKLAAAKGAKALVLGETFANLSDIEEKIDMPVLRPLIGFDKKEIARLARRIK